MTALFFIASGIVFWVVVLTWLTCAVWQYFSWSKEEREELISQVANVKRPLVVRHLEAVLTLFVLYPLFWVASFYKDE